MENKQPNLVKAFVFVAIAVILTATGTYAFFRANIEGTESTSTISVGGATLAVEYVGTQSITAEEILPGWSSKKYFYVDITNETGQEISFNVNLIVDNSNFYTTTNSTDSYLQYALYKCTSSSDKTCSTSIVGLTTLTRQSGTEVVGTVKTSEKDKVYYALELKFPDTGASQSQTGTNNQPLTFSGHITIDTSEGVYYKPTFANADWATIASMVKTDPKVFAVGSEKKVSIDGKDYTVRVANNTTPKECSNTGFSQTACGFVVEFVDIITGYNMNPTDTNVGGWPSSAMYKYLNGDTPDHLTYDGSNATLYSKLPSDLRSAIKDTYTVSGHGSKDTGTRSDGNFESTDKLYFLTVGEIYSDCLTSNCYDTSSYPYNSSGGTTTRQLDYYQNIGVSKSSYSGAIKQKNGSNASWWLRAAYPGNTNGFRIVNSDGYYYSYSTAYHSGGVAPAFRIG